MMVVMTLVGIFGLGRKEIEVLGGPRLLDC